jgi:hypothetical protein
MQSSIFHSGLSGMSITRREFIKYCGAVSGTFILGNQGGLAMANSDKSKVALVSTQDRKTGVVSSIQALGFNPVKNKDVLIKPNFNTADDTPGSTHNDTLTALIEEVWRLGAKTIR